jgi:hypothetical protein
MKNFFSGRSSALLAAVVKTVRVVVAAVVPVMLTVDGIEHVGESIAPEGELVSAQLRFTVPVNPPPGVTVIVD